MTKAVIKRNVKLFFKDKGLFFTSLITPAILLVLYATFLKRVFADSFAQAIPQGIEVSKNLMEGLVGGQLISSILAVSCITVPFCSNMLMVQDKVSGAIKDLSVTPVKGSSLALGYYFSTFISSSIVCVSGMAICLLYVAFTGWYLSAIDVLLLFLDVVILVMLGTALSSLVNFFLSTQGQISAVGTIVSSGYGFICGAYMPLSQFFSALKKVLSFLPGTHGTSLVRNHSMNGAFREFERIGFPKDTIDELKNVVDCNIYIGENTVTMPVMYAVVIGSICVVLGVYIILNVKKLKKK